MIDLANRMDTEPTHPEQYPERGRVAEHLLEAVPRLTRLISAEAQASDASGALTMTQLRALRLLNRGRRLPSELARDLSITPATASEVVDLLVRRGLVERGEVPEDRRLTTLQLTPTGLERLEAARARALMALERLLEKLEPADVAALERWLESLLDRLHEREPGATGSGHVG